MSMLSKDQIKQMIQHYDIKTTDDIKDAFKDMFGEAIQEIMEAELDTHLGYDKNSKEIKDTTNRRNGTISKTLRSSEFGEVPLTIPRDRNSEYEPMIVKKIKRLYPDWKTKSLPCIQRVLVHEIFKTILLIYTVRKFHLR